MAGLCAAGYELPDYAPCPHCGADEGDLCRGREIDGPVSLDDQRRAFCCELALVAHRAGELKLFKTMYKLNDALNTCGFEVATTLDPPTDPAA